MQLLNEQLVALNAGEEVEIPHFDFHTGQRRPAGARLRLPGRAVLILEGIHCLNDALTPAIPAAAKYKIYVSALTQLNLDDHNRISTTDNRLLRRIVRDHQFRGQARPRAPWPCGSRCATARTATSSRSRTPWTRPSTRRWTTS